MPEWRFEYDTSVPGHAEELAQIEQFIRTVVNPRAHIRRHREGRNTVLVYAHAVEAERRSTPPRSRRNIFEPMIQSTASDMLASTRWETVRLPESARVLSMIHDYATVEVPESDLAQVMEYALQASLEAVRVPKELLLPQSPPKVESTSPKTRFDLINESFG